MSLRLAVALVTGIALCACGREEITSATPPMDAAGTWWFTTTLSVVRFADGYRAQLYCYGTLTLTQEPGTGSLRGFIRYSFPECQGGSDLRGSVNAAGKVAFTMDGFRPFAPVDSPCPGATGVSFSGELSTFADLGTRLYAMGVTRVSCGQLGDHEFTYAFDGWRN
jgi:hypothetical protein